jgi:hypothetical protein
MSSHADRASAFKKAQKAKRSQKKILTATKHAQKNAEFADSDSSEASNITFDADCTAELEKAGYLVFQGYAAQYWQRAIDEDALVPEHVTKNLKEAIAFFKSKDYDITDDCVDLPGCSDDLSRYCVLNLI